MKQKQGALFPLGATVYEDGVNFALDVPHGKECTLLLYRKGEQEPFEQIELEERTEYGRIRSVFLEDCTLPSCEYHYLLNGEYYMDPYVRCLCKEEECVDPIRQSVSHGVLSNSEYDWEGDRPLEIPYDEVVAYSLHVRGFTKHSSSKVLKKGTFAGVIEKLPYLTELGINQIHLMPVYSFEQNGHYVNYWGYGPAYCFAPKSSYAYGSSPEIELKDLVKACHCAGIEVVLDLPFTDTMTKQMMIDCIHYYKLEYHIDGVIVNPYCAPYEELQRDPLLSNTKILKKQDEFQNTMRRFLKGDEGMVPSVMWWLRHISKEEGIFNYITTHTGFTLNDLVSYDQKHNELNGEKNQDGPDYNFSWNCGAEGPSRKKSVVELRKNQIKNAFLLLLLAQGTPCLLAGDEFLNSQKGNNNVYCQDNELSWLNWSRLEKEPWLHEFVKEVIRFRKSHPILHCREELLGVDRVASGIPDVSYHGEAAWKVPSEVSSRMLGVFYYGEPAGDVSCFVAYNMHWLEHEFALPALKKGQKWYRAVSTMDGVLDQEELLPDQKLVRLKDRTIEVFIGR